MQPLKKFSNCNLIPTDLPQNLKASVYSNFIIAKNWKQPKCPSPGEWIRKGLHLGK